MSSEKKIVLDLNPYCPPDSELYKVDSLGLERKYQKLCRIAKMDAWHDHHNIPQLDKTEIDKFVVEHIPDGLNCYKLNDVAGSGSLDTDSLLKNEDGQPSSEDIFLFRMLLNVHTWNNNKDLQPKLIKMCRPNCDGYIKDYGVIGDDNKQVFNANIVTNRYVVGHIPLGSDSEKEKNVCDPPIVYDKNNSQIQRFFEDHGINEDIFIIRDVAYGNWADDIKKWKQTEGKKETKIVTLQSAAGIFDPGPSTHYYSSAGVRQGFSDKTSRSYYGLFDAYNDVGFNNDETAILYPKIVKDNDDDDDNDNDNDDDDDNDNDDDDDDDNDNDNDDDDDEHKDSTILRNQLLFTRFDCTLYAKTLKLPSRENNLYTKGETEDFIESANVNFMVNDNNKIYISTKKNSNKAQKITELPKQDIIINLSASKDRGTFDSRVFQSYSYSELIKESGKLKIMTKKFGDHGQAVTACRSNLSYKLFTPTDTPQGVQITSEQSNGIHAFLSYDRVAVASAIYYGAPIVIFVNQSGALIFLSKQLRDAVNTPSEKLKSIQLSIQRKKDAYTYLSVGIGKLEKEKSLNDTIKEKIDKIKSYLGIIQDYIQKIYSYLFHDSAYELANVAKSDIVYQSLLMILFVTRSFINMYVTNIGENLFSFMTTLIAADTSYSVWETAYKPLEFDASKIDDIIQSETENLNKVSNIVNTLQNNITNYGIIENVEIGLENISTIISDNDSEDLYKNIYNVMSKLKLKSSTKDRFNSCNPYSGTQNERLWRSKLTKMSSQTMIGVVLCLPDFVTISENISDYVFKDFKLNETITKNITFTSIFSIILKKLYDKCNPRLSSYLYVSLGLNSNNTFDNDSRSSYNVQLLTHDNFLTTVDYTTFDTIESHTIDYTIPAIHTMEKDTDEDKEEYKEELTVKNLKQKEGKGFISKGNLRSHAKELRIGKKYGGIKNRKRRIKRTRRRKTMKKRKTKKKRKVVGGSDILTETQTQTYEEKIKNLPENKLVEQAKIISSELNKYQGNISDINKIKLQKELRMINETLLTRGTQPNASNTPFTGPGNKLGSDPKYTISAIVRNIIIIMKQNKVVREANSRDKLFKMDLDTYVRKTHILKQCEIALTIIGYSILMKDSSINVPQEGGELNDTIQFILSKIKELKIKESETTEYESDDFDDFDDTHPFTVLETIINNKNLLEQLNVFFIEEYDKEVIEEVTETIDQTENIKEVIGTITLAIKQITSQLNASYKIQEDLLGITEDDDELLELKSIVEKPNVTLKEIYEYINAEEEESDKSMDTEEKTDKSMDAEEETDKSMDAEKETDDSMDTEEETDGKSNKRERDDDPKYTSTSNKIRKNKDN